MDFFLLFGVFLFTELNSLLFLLVLVFNSNKFLVLF